MTPAYRVIGIDPSLSGTGLAHDNGLLTLMKTHTKDGNRRLTSIHQAAFECAGSGEWKGQRALCVIEDLPVNAMSAGKTGQAQGVVRLALVDAGLSILSIPPATLKKFATGSGRADKKLMIQTWNDYAHAKETDDNRVDAAWLREIGRQLMRHAYTGGGEDKIRPISRLATVARYLPIAERVLAGEQVQ